MHSDAHIAELVDALVDVWESLDQYGVVEAMLPAEVRPVTDDRGVALRGCQDRDPPAAAGALAAVQKLNGG